MVTKYAKWFALLLALIFASGVVTVITTNKITDLRIQKAQKPYEFLSVRDRERQLHCMTQNVYYEAASEPAEGKIAVAQIVMNRSDHPAFPKDPCQVIFQRNVFVNNVVCQFTWYCDGSVQRRPIDPKLWQESQEAAKMVLLEGFRLPTLKDALYYHADYVNPRWNKIKVTQIGRHIFYRPKQQT
jgi:spore germination cell wall hydrolase CwlJ-like protein